MISSLIKTMAIAPASGETPEGAPPDPMLQYGIYYDDETGELVAYCTTNGGAWGGGYHYMGWGEGNYTADLLTYPSGDYWVHKEIKAKPSNGTQYSMTIQMDGGPNGTYTVTLGEGNNF